VSFPNEVAILLHKEFPDLGVVTKQKLTAPEGARIDLFDTTKVRAASGLTFQSTKANV